jgi:hypothetical protein
VPGEYASKLRAHDIKFGMRASATDGGPPGPLEASLATANLQVLVSGAFGEGNKGLHSVVRELAASGAPRLQAKLGLDLGSAAARIRRVAYERIGLAIASGHAQQLLGSRASAASTCAARTAMERTWATRCSPARLSHSSPRPSAASK